MKHQKKILFVILIVAIIFGLNLFIFESDEQKNNHAASDKTETANLKGEKESPESKIPNDERNTTNGAPQENEFFSQMRKENQAVDQIYRHTLELLPNDKKSSIIIAEFTAEGIARRDTAEFVSYMQNLKQKIDDNSSEIIEILMMNESKLRNDRYVYQMLLNLVAYGDFSMEQKTEFYGKTIERKFEFDSSGKMAESAYNLTNSFIHMKNQNLDQDQIKSFIEKGILVNSSDPKSLKEYKARAAAYFPELVE